MTVPLAHPRRPPSTARTQHPAPAGSSQMSNGAVVERLARMRAACQALALELAGARRELKSVQAELRRVKRRYGED